MDPVGTASSELPGTGRYCGRFAPTPSGPLHFGSLVTALASFLDARHAGGRWLLRIDDLDRERSRPEHVETILRQLEAHGLLWDGPVHRQSSHLPAYEAALDRLLRAGLCYRCDCTRARLAAESLPGPDDPVYSGRCRERGIATGTAALRLRVGTGRVAIEDAWRGRIDRDLASEIGDFVVQRADSTIGYQLASVVDEHLLDVTHVVRGADLVGSSLRQAYLHRLLYGLGPAFRHIPLVLDARGRKLSKQNHAAPLDADAAPRQLARALAALDQSVPSALIGCDVGDLLGWATRHWTPSRLPRESIAEPSS